MIQYNQSASYSTLSRTAGSSLVPPWHFSETSFHLEYLRSRQPNTAGRSLGRRGHLLSWFFATALLRPSSLPERGHACRRTSRRVSIKSRRSDRFHRKCSIL